ncbi:MAG: hypothetical protein U9N02_04565 [Campylobacterota bacterium]|nr:hypothetical protein [Campylobacterota bacterium]
MKINKKDFLNIKTLLEKGSITEGKFKNKEIINSLKQNDSIYSGKKTAKIRYIHLLNANNVFLFLKNNKYFINSIDDIDNYICEILDSKASRDKIQKWHNNTKFKGSESLKGLYVSSINNIDIKINDEIITIVPNNGVGYFLFYTEKIELFKDTIIVGIENYQVVWFAKKYKKFFNDNVLFVVINSYMLKWISNLENEYIHFGDYDLSGIDIYINKIIPKLEKSKKHTMFIPNNIELLIKKYGDAKLYQQQIRHKDLIVHDIKINKLKNLLNKYKKAIEQEGIYL